MLDLLTLTSGEYNMRKLCALSNGIGGSRKGEKMCKITQEVGAKNTENRCKCGQSMNFGVLRTKIGCEANSRGRFGKCAQKKGPELWPDKRILHHDNAPALRDHEYLAKKSITKMDHHLIQLT
jgi:hypothetical protein